MRLAQTTSSPIQGKTFSSYTVLPYICIYTVYILLTGHRVFLDEETLIKILCDYGCMCGEDDIRHLRVMHAGFIFLSVSSIIKKNACHV